MPKGEKVKRVLLIGVLLASTLYESLGSAQASVSQLRDSTQSPCVSSPILKTYENRTIPQSLSMPGDPLVGTNETPPFEVPVIIAQFGLDLAHGAQWRIKFEKSDFSDEEIQSSSSTSASFLGATAERSLQSITGSSKYLSSALTFDSNSFKTKKPLVIALYIYLHPRISMKLCFTASAARSLLSKTWNWKCQAVNPPNGCNDLYSSFYQSNSSNPMSNKLSDGISLLVAMGWDRYLYLVPSTFSYLSEFVPFPRSAQSDSNTIVYAMPLSGNSASMALAEKLWTRFVGDSDVCHGKTRVGGLNIQPGPSYTQQSVSFSSSETSWSYGLNLSASVSASGSPGELSSSLFTFSSNQGTTSSSGRYKTISLEVENTNQKSLSEHICPLNDPNASRGGQYTGFLTDPGPVVFTN